MRRLAACVRRYKTSLLTAAQSKIDAKAALAQEKVDRRAAAARAKSELKRVKENAKIARAAAMKRKRVRLAATLLIDVHAYTRMQAPTHVPFPPFKSIHRRVELHISEQPTYTN
jgi:hypothetical protein